MLNNFPPDPAVGSSGGSVYTFVSTGLSTWSQSQMLNGPSSTIGWGYSAAVSGNLLAVGAISYGTRINNNIVSHLVDDMYLSMS